MSRRPYGILKYVDRSDVSDTFEDEVLNVLEEDNLVMIGLPGVGKSPSAMTMIVPMITLSMRVALVINSLRRECRICDKQ